RSVARQRTLCRPGPTLVSRRHIRHVFLLTSPASSACCHGPSSICTSTLSMPVYGAHAVPATRAFDPSTVTLSTRECVFTGPLRDQPRGTQYGVRACHVVTSRSTSHLVAETKP